MRSRAISGAAATTIARIASPPPRAHGGLSPGSLAKLLGRMAHPARDRAGCRSRRRAASAKLECAIADALERLRALWPKAQTEVRRLLFEQNKWANRPFNDADAMEEALRGVDRASPPPTARSTRWSRS